MFNYEMDSYQKKKQQKICNYYVNRDFLRMIKFALLDWNFKNANARSKNYRNFQNLSGKIVPNFNFQQLQ